MLFLNRTYVKVVKVFEILDFKVWKLIKKFNLFRFINNDVLKIFLVASEFFYKFILPYFTLGL